MDRTQAPAAEDLLALMPAGLTLLLAFDAGRYFPDATARSAIVVCVIAAVWAIRSALAGGGLRRRGALATGALAAFGGWALLSGTWSDAPARALLDADRVLLYVLVLGVCAA